eukprot:SAG31_NODE_1150_length_9648_cov_37.362656_7_plen_413_part_00
MLVHLLLLSDLQLSCAQDVEDWTYLGCFHDNNGARDLQAAPADRGHLVATNPLDAANECAEICDGQGFRYFGLQFTNECFCDNSYRNGYGSNNDMGDYGVADIADCDADGTIEDGVADLCSNGDENNCANRNAVYRIGPGDDIINLDYVEGLAHLMDFFSISEEQSATEFLQFQTGGFFVVKSGPCTRVNHRVNTDVVHRGKCVGRVGGYGNSEHCDIQAASSFTLGDCLSFNTESCCDKVTIRGVGYSGTRCPRGASLDAGQVFSWRSDSSVTRTGGWLLCVSDADFFAFETRFSYWTDVAALIDADHVAVSLTVDRFSTTDCSRANTLLEGEHFANVSIAGLLLSPHFSEACASEIKRDVAAVLGVTPVERVVLVRVFRASTASESPTVVDFGARPAAGQVFDAADVVGR